MAAAGISMPRVDVLARKRALLLRAQVPGVAKPHVTMTDTTVAIA